MKKRAWPWVLVGLIVLLASCCGGTTLVLTAVTLAGDLASLGDAVAVITVRGLIMAGDADGFAGSGITYADRVVAEIEQATSDPRIKAIVLEIDSPGGSVVGSADIHRALEEAELPIVASMGEVAASGGYYIACGAERIVVRPDTITGSIGVRWQFTDASGLMEKLGVRITMIQSGAFKDAGGWHRALTDEERAQYQAIVDEAYEAFVDVVVLGRGLSREAAYAVADGRVFTGREAIALGLADDEGNLDDAIALAGELAGIEGEPRVVRYHRPVSPWQLLFGLAQRAARPSELALLHEVTGLATPRLQYLYVAP